MKRIIKGIATILAGVLLSQSLFVSAANMPKSDMRMDTSVDLLNPLDYIEANARLVHRGKIVRMQKAGKTLEVEHFYQDGGQIWSNDVMQTCGKTIAAAGCCLTSFTMIHHYLGGIYNPRGVNEKLGNAACPFEYTTAATVFDLTISNYNRDAVSDDYAVEFILGAIDSGYPVLVGMTKDTSSQSTHFVTAYGYNGDKVYIHDPTSTRDYTELSQYFEEYYVDRLYVYKK